MICSAGPVSHLMGESRASGVRKSGSQMRSRLVPTCGAVERNTMAAYLAKPISPINVSENGGQQASLTIVNRGQQPSLVTCDLLFAYLDRRLCPGLRPIWVSRSTFFFDVEKATGAVRKVINICGGEQESEKDQTRSQNGSEYLNTTTILETGNS